MSDKETKGAYLPFRGLMVANIAYLNMRVQSFRLSEFEKSLKYLDYVAMAQACANRYSEEKEMAINSLNHYDELLRLHKMEEVK